LIHFELILGQAERQGSRLAILLSLATWCFSPHFYI
jgi:hypothetical protein